MPYLTLKEAAAEARVQPRTVRRWVDEEGLRAHRTPGKILIDPADLKAFLANTQPKRRRKPERSE